MAAAPLGSAPAGPVPGPVVAATKTATKTEVLIKANDYIQYIDELKKHTITEVDENNELKKRIVDAAAKVDKIEIGDSKIQDIKSNSTAESIYESLKKESFKFNESLPLEPNSIIKSDLNIYLSNRFIYGDTKLIDLFKAIADKTRVYVPGATGEFLFREGQKDKNETAKLQSILDTRREEGDIGFKARNDFNFIVICQSIVNETLEEMKKKIGTLPKDKTITKEELEETIDETWKDYENETKISVDLNKSGSGTELDFKNDVKSLVKEHSKHILLKIIEKLAQTNSLNAAAINSEQEDFNDEVIFSFHYSKANVEKNLKDIEAAPLDEVTEKINIIKNPRLVIISPVDADANAVNTTLTTSIGVLTPQFIKLDEGHNAILPDGTKVKIINVDPGTQEIIIEPAIQKNIAEGSTIELESKLDSISNAKNFLTGFQMEGVVFDKKNIYRFYQTFVDDTKISYNKFAKFVPKTLFNFGKNDDMLKDKEADFNLEKDITTIANKSRSDIVKEINNLIGEVKPKNKKVKNIKALGFTFSLEETFYALMEYEFFKLMPLFKIRDRSLQGSKLETMTQQEIIDEEIAKIDIEKEIEAQKPIEEEERQKEKEFKEKLEKLGDLDQQVKMLEVQVHNMKAIKQFTDNVESINFLENIEDDKFKKILEDARDIKKKTSGDKINPTDPSEKNTKWWRGFKSVINLILLNAPFLLERTGRILTRYGKRAITESEKFSKTYKETSYDINNPTEEVYLSALSILKRMRGLEKSKRANISKSLVFGLLKRTYINIDDDNLDKELKKIMGTHPFGDWFKIGKTPLGTIGKEVDTFEKKIDKFKKMMDTKLIERIEAPLDGILEKLEKKKRSSKELKDVIKTFNNNEFIKGIIKKSDENENQEMTHVFNIIRAAHKYAIDDTAEIKATYKEIEKSVNTLANPPPTFFSFATTLATPTKYTIEIDGDGPPNTFKWSKDSEASYDANTVAITAEEQTLENNVTIKFPTTTGYSVGKKFEFDIPQGNNIIIPILIPPPPSPPPPAPATTLATPTKYTIEIDGNSPNTFNWSKDSGVNYVAEKEVITAEEQTLENNVTIKFPTNTGYSAGHKFEFEIPLGNNIIIPILMPSPTSATSATSLPIIIIPIITTKIPELQGAITRTLGLIGPFTKELEASMVQINAIVIRKFRIFFTKFLFLVINTHNLIVNHINKIKNIDKTNMSQSEVLKLIQYYTDIVNLIKLVKTKQDEFIKIKIIDVISEPSKKALIDKMETEIVTIEKKIDDVLDKEVKELSDSHEAAIINSTATATAKPYKPPVPQIDNAQQSIKSVIDNYNNNIINLYKEISDYLKNIVESQVSFIGAILKIAPDGAPFSLLGGGDINIFNQFGGSIKKVLNDFKTTYGDTILEILNEVRITKGINPKDNFTNLKSEEIKKIIDVSDRILNLPDIKNFIDDISNADRLEFINLISKELSDLFIADATKTSKSGTEEEVKLDEQKIKDIFEKEFNEKRRKELAEKIKEKYNKKIGKSIESPIYEEIEKPNEKKEDPNTLVFLNSRLYLFLDICIRYFGDVGGDTQKLQNLKEEHQKLTDILESEDIPFEKQFKNILGEIINAFQEIKKLTDNQNIKAMIEKIETMYKKIETETEHTYDTGPIEGEGKDDESLYEAPKENIDQKIIDNLQIFMDNKEDEPKTEKFNAAVDFLNQNKKRMRDKLKNFNNDQVEAFEKYMEERGEGVYEDPQEFLAKQNEKEINVGIDKYIEALKSNNEMGKESAIKNLQKLDRKHPRLFEKILNKKKEENPILSSETIESLELTNYKEQPGNFNPLEEAGEEGYYYLASEKPNIRDVEQALEQIDDEGKPENVKKGIDFFKLHNPDTIRGLIVEMEIDKKEKFLNIYKEKVLPKIQELLEEVKTRLKTIYDLRLNLLSRTNQQFKEAMTYLSDNFPDNTHIPIFLNIHMPEGEEDFDREKGNYLGYYDVYKKIKKDPTYVYNHKIAGGYRNLKTRKIKRKSKKKSSSINKRSHSKGKKNNSKKKRKITKKK